VQTQHTHTVGVVGPSYLWSFVRQSFSNSGKIDSNRGSTAGVEVTTGLGSSGMRFNSHRKQ